MLHRSAAASNAALHPFEAGIHLVHSAPAAFVRRPRKPAALRLLAPGKHVEQIGHTLSLPARALQGLSFFVRHLPRF